MTRFLDTHLSEQAQERPDKAAFVFNGEELSFADLASRSDQLERILGSLQIGRGDRVGIYMDKCLDMPVAVYGILKSGAAYVPLDTTAPAVRTASIIEDCEITTIISHPTKSASLRELCTSASTLTHSLGPEIEVLTTLSIDSDDAVQRPCQSRSIDDPAYILFTSGSTGKPKGMLHTHASGLAYTNMAARLFSLTEADRMANQSPLHFDMAMLEFFSGTSQGATVIMVPEVLTKLPASLSKLVEDERLTTWYSVPFALIQLAEYGALDNRDLSSLRWIIYAGAPMSNRHLHKLQTALPHARFSNAYGPAEANQVTYHHLPPEPHPVHVPVPIGKPCEHTQIQIAEDGELLIASTALMQGYWNRDDLNNTAFTFRKGTRYYRTGDLVSQSDDGTMIYLGRRDRQVKIRGFRIELDEVELAVSSHPSVFEVAVQVADDGLTLEAFITCTQGKTTTQAEIQTHLRHLLPATFIPSNIEILDEFERTATGKINRTALRKTA